MSPSDAESTLIAPAASPEITAAIVAALERFRRATAPRPPAASEDRDPWLQAAILEGVQGEPEADARDPWINT
jgi:hypothetical protein